MNTNVLARGSSSAKPALHILGTFLTSSLWLGFHLALAYALYIGWRNRFEGHLTPEEGVGYWLGISGVIALVVLLIYPLRKRMKYLRTAGSIPFWFRLHMALGLLAPTLILLHCNFKPGSTNSSTALFTMLIVAASGLVGRYLYGRVNGNMVGERIKASNYFDEIEDLPGVTFSAEANRRLHELTTQAIAPRLSLLQALSMRASVARKSSRLIRQIHRKTLQKIDREAKQNGTDWLTRRQRRNAFTAWIKTYHKAVRQASALAVYERLFALWHVLHLPLFALLVLAVIVHVIAVHLY